MKPVVAALIVVLFVPVAALSQEKAVGMYVTYDLQQTTIELDNGGSIDQGTYGQFVTTADTDNPLANTKGRCMGETSFSDSDEVIAAAGLCVLRNADGDAYWFWWKQDEIGTADCPFGCGVWSIFHGTGVFDGVTGTGTWRTSDSFPDLTGVGDWKLKFD
jgi:hypothetical protein